MPRPATGKTMPRSLRIPEDVWQAALEAARAEGRTLTDVVVAYLRRYAARTARKGSSDGE